MMKRIWMLLLVGLLVLTAGPARAWEENFRAASGDLFAGTATKVYESSIQSTVFKCTGGTGCTIALHGFIPKSATSPNITINWNRLSPNGSNPVVQERVCALAFSNTNASTLSQAANILNYTCSSQTTLQLGATWQVFPTSIFGLTTPTMVSAAKNNCTMADQGQATDCNGDELYILIEMQPAAQDIEYTMLTVRGS